MLDDASHACTTDGNARDCGDMIGLKRVLHSKQKAKPQHPQHMVLKFTRRENPIIQTQPAVLRFPDDALSSW
jgi:hypothetical protein